MSDSFDKTQTGIQTGADSGGKAPASGGGTFDKKKAVIAGAGFLAMLGILFGISQLKQAKAGRKPSADEAQITARENVKKGELADKVKNLEQAPVGKDGKFDEQGNYLGPAVQQVELPENAKGPGAKVGKPGSPESAIDQLAMPEQKQGAYSNFSGGYQPSGGGSRHEEADPGVMREQTAIKKEERELLAASMLGYSRSRAQVGGTGAAYAVRTPQSDADAKRAALAASANQVAQAVRGGGMVPPVAAGAGVGGQESGYIQATPGTGRSFTRPGEVADMRIHNGEYVRVPEGKSLECVLVNEVLAQAHQSPVIVTVSRDFRSADGRLLAPAGSRLVGMADRIEDMNQERMFTAFNRLDYAGQDGATAWFPEHRIPEGLSPIGSLGVEGKVKRGIMKALMSSIALGVVQGMGAAAAGPVKFSTTTGMSEISAGQMASARVADQLNRFSEKVLTRYMNMVPQVILKPGTRIRVYLSEDTLMSVIPEAEGR